MSTKRFSSFLIEKECAVASAVLVTPSLRQLTQQGLQQRQCMRCIVRQTRQPTYSVAINSEEEEDES